MIETMIPPQVGMRLWKKRGQKKRRHKKEKKRKREKGQCYYPFSTLVLQSSTMIFMIESLLFCHFHILVGIFHNRTWLVYSNDGLPQNALGLREQASWMHTHQFFCCCAFIHLQLQCICCMAIPTPHVDINRWASPQPIDYPRQCETFSFFVFFHAIYDDGGYVEKTKGRKSHINEANQ